MARKTKIIVLGLIKNSDKKYLISQRYDPDVLEAHLKWDFPGGTNEFGESLEDTLKREFLEETGLNVEVEDMFSKCCSRIWEHKQFQMHTLVFCFNCKLISGKLHLNDPKINDLKWISENQFKDFEFLSTAQFFIDLLFG